jgi:hypothetical protein
VEGGDAVHVALLDVDSAVVEIEGAEHLAPARRQLVGVAR